MANKRYKKCLHCGLLNVEDAQQCNCGYDFSDSFDSGNFCLGFIGWFVIASIIYPFIASAYGPFLLGVITLLVIYYLLKIDKFACGIGIISAVVTNVIVWLAIFGNDELLYSIIPLPFGLFIARI